MFSIYNPKFCTLFLQVGRRGGRSIKSDGDFIGFTLEKFVEFHHDRVIPGFSRLPTAAKYGDSTIL